MPRPAIVSIDRSVFGVSSSTVTCDSVTNMDPYNTQKQSKRPLIITAIATIIAFFVVWNVFFKGPEIPLVQKVNNSKSSRASIY